MRVARYPKTVITLICPIFKSLAYCSDTAPFPQLADYISGCDMIYHEATFGRIWLRAHSTMHSTAEDAALAARDAGATRLLIGTFHQDERSILLLEEAREIFPETFIAHEGMTFDIPLLR